MRCTGVEYGDNRIHASDTWWEMKIKENHKYKQFKDQDCSEYKNTYERLFGGTCDSTQYAYTPTKMSLRGFGLGPDSKTESPKDTIPVNDEGTDSSNGQLCILRAVTWTFLPHRVDQSVRAVVQREGEGKRKESVRESCPLQLKHWLAWVQIWNPFRWHANN